MVRILGGFLVISLFLTPHLYAESRAFDCRSKPFTKARGEEIVGQVQDEFSKVSRLEANFQQDSFLSALEVSEGSSGTMIFEKPGKMRWDYKEPEKQIFTIKDKTVWLFQEAEKQVVIDNFSDVIISDLPIAFLMGIGNLKTDFTLSEACESADGIVLSLKPKGGNEGRNELKTLALLASPSSHLPIGGKVTDVAGNVTSIVLKGVSRDPEISKETFATNFPSGTDISDHRLAPKGEKVS